MLFGDKRTLNHVTEIIEEYGRNNDIIPIYGAMVGSISRDVFMADSDYDTRILYLRKDFPHICIPSEMDEKELHSRYYPEDIKIYEFIPFWEFTSFIQFLKEPRFKGEEIHPSLYNLIGWTFYSPYVWDPYGLRNKIVPLIELVFDKSYPIIHHQNLISNYIAEFDNEEMLVKRLISCVHSAGSIEWMLKYNRQPPINLQSILLGLDRDDIWNDVSIILKETREYVHSEVEKYGQKSELFRLHFNAASKGNRRITEFVKVNYDKSKEIERANISPNIDIIIERIYTIVQDTLNDKTILEAR